LPRQAASSWLSRDPYGEPGFELSRLATKSKAAIKVDLYTFVFNDPLNRCDSLGLLADPTDVFRDVEAIMEGLKAGLTQMLKSGGFVALCRCGACIAAMDVQLGACAIYTDGDDWVRCSCDLLKESKTTNLLCKGCVFFMGNPVDWARNYIGCDSLPPE
jgi:hypothetical protein